jgi:outer membrane lipoprotein
MSKRPRPFFFFVLFLFLTSCVHVISKDLQMKADPALTFGEVIRNPDAFKGRTVIWGGEIIETTNEKDGDTVLEIFQRPLSWREEPQETAASEGRFLVRVEKYLDPYVYRRGRKVTVAGEILGEEVRPVGKMDYRYPLVLSRELYLWTYYYYPYSYYPYPDYYGPWGYNYPWVPGWGWGWGWGFRHYHHH